MNAREVLAELDRLGIWVGRERAYPELLRAIEERTPGLLRLASFKASRHTPATYVRRPGGAA